MFRKYVKSTEKVMFYARKSSKISPHNPEVVGSSPASATMTGVLIGSDPLRTLVILLPILRWFVTDIDTSADISDHFQRSLRANRQTAKCREK